MYGRESQGNEICGVYKYIESEHRHRIGDCKPPNDGELCLCVVHSGDCFNSYYPLTEGDDGSFRADLDRKFGAYVFGYLEGKFSDRDYHLLCAGEKVVAVLTKEDG